MQLGNYLFVWGRVKWRYRMYGVIQNGKSPIWFFGLSINDEGMTESEREMKMSAVFGDTR